MTAAIIEFPHNADLHAAWQQERVKRQNMQAGESLLFEGDLIEGNNFLAFHMFAEV